MFVKTIGRCTHCRADGQIIRPAGTDESAICATCALSLFACRSDRPVVGLVYCGLNGRQEQVAAFSDKVVVCESGATYTRRHFASTFTGDTPCHTS